MIEDKYPRGWTKCHCGFKMPNDKTISRPWPPLTCDDCYKSIAVLVYMEMQWGEEPTFTGTYFADETAANQQLTKNLMHAYLFPNKETAFVCSRLLNASAPAEHYKYFWGCALIHKFYMPAGGKSEDDKLPRTELHSLNFNHPQIKGAKNDD